MTVTRVPIAPIGKGSMMKLWGGLAAIAALAGGLAWAGTAPLVGSGCADSDVGKVIRTQHSPGGVVVGTMKGGKGGSPTMADVALINYRGTLKDGTEFDANKSVPMPLAGVIKGFSEALAMMQPGGSYKICIPSNLGYGNQAAGDKIPPNSTLLFDIDLLDFKSQAEIQAMQQMMQQQQGAAGAAGAPPPQQ